MIELTLLQTLRLKGRASLDTLAEAAGADRAESDAEIARLVESGWAREVNGHYLLLPAGRGRLAALLDAERAGIDRRAFQEEYERFTPVNGDFKQLANDWQLRGETPNDHSDAAYDAEVLSRLPEIHRRVTPIVRHVTELAPRLASYPARLDAALARVEAGEHEWLLKPLIDSYHTIWFELHEELIGLAGLSREAEAAAGRAH